LGGCGGPYRGPPRKQIHWFIDGYNVIRRDADLKGAEARGLEAGRAALLALVARLAREVADEFTVVFDGARRSGGAPSPGRVQVVFSRPPETADDVLRRRAAALREGAVIVTSDRAVQSSVTRTGAVAVSAEEFLDAASTPAEDDRDDEDDEDAGPTDRRGPSRRPSREARARARVLRRLRTR
jgi:predicted RNA-binding protein with PIN domain